MIKDLNIPEAEQKKIRKAIDELLPDEEPKYKIKISFTPKFDELVETANKLSKLLKAKKFIYWCGYQN